MAAGPARSSGPKGKDGPEARRHGILSQAIFTWIEPLIRRGAAGETFGMEEGRRFVPAAQRADPMYERFKEAWAKAWRTPPLTPDLQPHNLYTTNTADSQAE